MCLKSQLHCPQKFLFQAVYRNSFLMVSFSISLEKLAHTFVSIGKVGQFFFFLTEDRSDLVHWCDKRD